MLNAAKLSKFQTVQLLSIRENTLPILTQCNYSNGSSLKMFASGQYCQKIIDTSEWHANTATKKPQRRGEVSKEKQ